MAARIRSQGIHYGRRQTLHSFVVTLTLRRSTSSCRFAEAEAEEVLPYVADSLTVGVYDHWELALGNPVLPALGNRWVPWLVKPDGLKHRGFLERMLKSF